MLLNSRSAWQSTGYPWNSFDNPVKTLYDATNVSRAGRWIYERKIKILGEFTGKLYRATNDNIILSSLIVVYGGLYEVRRTITWDESGSMCNRLWDTSKIFKFNPVRSYGDISVNLLWLMFSLTSVLIPINDPPSDSNSLWSNFKCSIPVTGSLIIYRKKHKKPNIIIFLNCTAHIPHSHMLTVLQVHLFILHYITSEWPLSLEIVLCDKSTNLSSFNPFISANENSAILLYDKLISDSWVSGNSDLFKCLMQLLLSSNTSIIDASSNSSDANWEQYKINDDVLNIISNTCRPTEYVFYICGEVR